MLGKVVNSGVMGRIRLAAVKVPVSVKGAVGQVGGSGTPPGGVTRFVVQKSSTMGPLDPRGNMDVRFPDVRRERRGDIQGK